MSEFIELLVSGESFATAIGELFKVAGVMALAIVLIVGLIFFLPTIIATLRHIKLRVLVCNMRWYYTERWYMCKLWT